MIAVITEKEKIELKKTLLSTYNLDNLLSFKNLFPNETLPDTYDKNVALIISCREGNLDLIKYLISQNTNIKNVTAFSWAVVNRHLDVLIYFLKNTCSAQQEIDTFLALASEYGYEEIVEYLLKYHADPCAKYKIALVQAIQNKHLDVLKLILFKSY